MKNPKVVLLSIIGLIFIILSFLVDWFFIFGAVIVIIWNQKQLMKKK